MAEEPLYSAEPNKNPDAQPQNPVTNPLQVRLDRKAEVEAALDRGDSLYTGKSPDQLKTELFWIGRWLEVNAARYPDPYPPDAA